MEKIKNMGIIGLIKELKMLNPNTEIRFETSAGTIVIIARCTELTRLKLPKGYEINNNKLTNKGNGFWGEYEAYKFMTEYDYLVSLA